MWWGVINSYSVISRLEVLLQQQRIPESIYASEFRLCQWIWTPFRGFGTPYQGNNLKKRKLKKEAYNLTFFWGGHSRAVRFQNKEYTLYFLLSTEAF